MCVYSLPRKRVYRAVAYHSSHAALPMVTLTISPYTNVTLTSDFDSGLDHPVHGGNGGGHPIRRRNKVTVTQKKIKSGHGPHRGPGTEKNWLTDRQSQYNLNLRHCTANYRPVLSSERAPYLKMKESNCHSKKCNIWSSAPKEARHQDELAD
jgi:hypothetical protein